MMKKIWLDSYPDQVPQSIDPDHFSSIIDIFRQSCEQYADKTAFINFKTSMSYGELYTLSEHFAAFLQQELGVQQGDPVAIMLPNLLQYPVALFAILRLGGIVVNVNPMYTPRELAHQLNDSGAKTIIVLDKFAKTVEAASDQTSLENIIVSEAGDLFPFIKRCLATITLKYIKRAIPDYDIPGAISFRRGIEAGRQLKFDAPSIEGADIALLQYTGGTTGVAKGAMLSHRNIVANLEQISAWINGAVTPGKEKIVTALPLYHIFSFTANCLTFMKLGAENLLITDPRDMKHFIAELNNFPFSVITGVNTLFNGLLNHRDFAQVDFSHLRLALGGGMPVQETVAEHWQALTGVPLLEAYGLTETSPGVAINPLNLKEYNGSIGLPLPSTEISLRNVRGEECAVGEDGELWVRGPQVMQGYWNQPEETAQVFDQDGWLVTGDMAVMDQGGFLRILERKKDMILISGFNVFPSEVEAIIAAHPGVQEVAVIGEPHEVSGERVKAFIVKKDPTLTEADVISHCREQLTSYKVPKRIVFIDSLPKSNIGKILRRSLRNK